MPLGVHLQPNTCSGKVRQSALPLALMHLLGGALPTEDKQKSASGLAARERREEGALDKLVHLQGAVLKKERREHCTKVGDSQSGLGNTR